MDATRQTSQAVEEPWRAAREASDTWREPTGLPRHQDPVAQGRQQRAGLAALVAWWWQTVPQDWAPRAMPPGWPPWADEVVWPLMAGPAPLRRTRHQGHKAPRGLVLQAVAEACAQPPWTRPLTPEGPAGWQAWAAEHA